MKTLVPRKLMLACLLAAGALVWQQGWWATSPSGTVLAPQDAPVGAVTVATAAAALVTAEPDFSSVTVPSRSSAAPSATVRRVDPFSYPAPVAQEVESRSEASEPEADPLVLQAISLEGDSALAVINRQIVAVNEQVDAWRVDRIESHVVWLEGPGGRRALRFPGAPDTGKPDPGTVAALVPLSVPHSVSHPEEAP
jgi:hypothetical protein